MKIVVGGDAIYENRVKLSKAGIQTDFNPKKAKHKALIRKMITKERTSRLEGSFGTGKEYFLLNQIKARTQKTEVLWSHTSNALNIGQRMSLQKAKLA